MQHTQSDYDSQLEEKQQQTAEEFAELWQGPIDTIQSPISHYRMRAEFRVWHEGEDLYYIMFDQQTREKYRVDQFPAASKLINTLMPVLMEEIKGNQTLRHKIFQIDFLTTLSGEAVVSLLYHRQLDDTWESELRALKERLTERGYSIHFIGRARKQKRVIDQEYVTETLTVHGTPYIYRQVENSFTQPNATVAQQMLEWAVDVTKNSEDDLLELYCGNGNFSIALAQNFRRVLATELAKPSVDSAQWNIQENKVDNLKIARLSAEELTEAIEEGRSFRRLEQQNIDLTEYNFTTVLVDPPRAGMDDESVKMVQQYDTIVYISCNPLTLKDNLDTLCQTHDIQRMALFDQFPYTHHREVGVLLQRK
jgi:tRNA (uracil-5-)-methyltransferase